MNSADISVHLYLLCKVLSGTDHFLFLPYSRENQLRPDYIEHHSLRLGGITPIDWDTRCAIFLGYFLAEK